MIIPKGKREIIPNFGHRKYDNGRIYYTKMIQDVCDYCFHYKYMVRNKLKLRLRGKKFICFECRHSGKHDDAIKEDKPLPCYDPPKNPGMVKQ